MKKIILFIGVLFFITGAVHSQVRIGKNDVPEKGALLDLNANAGYKGGLLLPNVDITDLEKIPASFSETSVRNQETNVALTGTIVWNTHSGAEGIYMWDGTKWTMMCLTPPCAVLSAPTITYTTGHPVIVPASTASAAGTLTATLYSADADSYEISSAITPIWGSPAGGLTASLTGSVVTFSGLQYGSYEIQVRAMGSGYCEPSAYRTDTVYVGCGALVADNTWKAFMCHNLGADYSVDPFTPTYATNGAYYQWGRKDPAKSDPNFTGSDAFAIPWIDQNPAGSFGDGSTNYDITVKSANDPCPDGFRVPNYNELNGALTLNPKSTVGNWATTSSDSTAWGIAMWGNALPVQAAGEFGQNTPALANRGRAIYMWANLSYSTITDAVCIMAQKTSFGFYHWRKSIATSIRCIKE